MSFSILFLATATQTSLCSTASSFVTQENTLPRPVLSMVLKQTSPSVLSLVYSNWWLLLKACNTRVTNSSCDPSLLSASLSFRLSNTQTHWLVLVRGGATSTSSYFLLLSRCSSVSREVRETWTKLKQLIHVIPCTQGKITILWKIFFFCQTASDKNLIKEKKHVTHFHINIFWPSHEVLNLMSYIVKLYMMSQILDLL